MKVFRSVGMDHFTKSNTKMKQQCLYSSGILKSIIINLVSRILDNSLKVCILYLPACCEYLHSTQIMRTFEYEIFAK